MFSQSHTFSKWLTWLCLASHCPSLLLSQTSIPISLLGMPLPHTLCSECKRRVPKPHSFHAADRVRSLLHGTLRRCIAFAYTSHDIPHIQENMLLKAARVPHPSKGCVALDQMSGLRITFFNLLNLPCSSVLGQDWILPMNNMQ